MQLESMFTDQKWNILKSLSKEPLSPLQLASKLNTTMANVSQQLKLLEAVNLVKKEKIRNREKGKPRTLFSLTGDYAFVVPLAKDFAEKKLLSVSDHQRIILRIWFLQNQRLQGEMEKLYWKMSDQLQNIHALAADDKGNKIYLSTEDKELAKLKHPDLTILSHREMASQFPKLQNSCTLIYASKNFLARASGG